MQATTATSGTDGLAAGDVVVKMSEPFRKQLEEAVTAVAKTCGITRKWKRQVENEGRYIRFGKAHALCDESVLTTTVLTCLLNEASKKAQDPSFLDFAASELEDIGLDLGADPTALLGAAGEVLKSQLLKKKYYLLVAGLVTTGAVGAALEVDRVIRPSFGIPGKFKFPDGQLSKPKEDDEKPSPTSSSSACDPKKTPDENSVS